MDIMQIWGAYQKNADPETIFPMYQECALNAKAVGYGDANLLHIASQNAHPEAVVWLLEQGLKPNEASGYGELPLFLLARKGFSCGYLPRKGDIYRTAQALLDGGGNVLRRDSDGRFCYAASNGMQDVITLLEDEQRQTDHAGNTTLHQACYQNQSEVAEALIREGRVDLNAPNDEGDTPLLMACQNQNVYLVEILLKAGAAPNQKMLDGFSPLHYAALGGNYAIARALLMGGADSNLRNLDGETPLILAAREGYNDMTALLIENGADVNLVDNLQQSALYYATENGFTEIVEQLLMAGAEG